MSDDIKISVIIPIFSVARYLPECIESVIKQSYTNIEIILVDDGSADESPEICDQYAGRYRQIKVIHKKNGGLSDARNTGIHSATGDYIVFLDGDDYWDDTDALLTLTKRLAVTNADVLNFSYKKYFEDTGENIPYFYEAPEMPLENRTKEAQLDYLSGRGLYIASACNKLIRKTLLTDKMLFRAGIYSEDVEWCARLLNYADSMDFICANFYCYRQRRDSITHTINDKKCRDLCNNIIGCFNLLEEADQTAKEALGRYTAYQYGTFFKVQAQAKNSQKECVDKLEPYQWILSKHCGNKKLRILSIGCRIFGYRTLCKMIRFAYHIRYRSGE